jgi:hypothetical protein
MMRDTATAAVILALLTTFNQTAAAQDRRGGPPDPFGPQAARGSASIVGRVLTPDSNSPVRGADVVAVNENGGRIGTTTDENGSYRLERLAEGEWRVTASKGGYVSWQFGQRRPFQLPHRSR